MGDIKLFRLEGEGVEELAGRSTGIEKQLQTQMERNMRDLLGVDVLASEYGTGKSHRGRIDTLGLDENGCPVIVEYKRAVSENVINQGLFYLDWLMDHKAEFEALTARVLGPKTEVDWSAPRLLCVASDFTRYDEHAVAQIGRNIELVRYKTYGNDLLLLELVNSGTETSEPEPPVGQKKTKYKTVSQMLEEATPEMTELFSDLKAYAESLGDDVSVKPLKFYYAFRRLNNFACVEIRNQAKSMLVYLKVDPGSVQLRPGFTRDVSNVGHYGTGNLEVIVRTRSDLDAAKELVRMSYELS